MLRDILHHPNKLLRKRSAEVSGWDDEIEQLLVDMVDTVRAANGAGLAAIQIGIPRRAIVLSIDDGSVMPYLNPRIVKGTGEIVSTERCLSVPGRVVKVRRYRALEFTHLDRSGETRLVKVIHPEFAVAIQHELDHVNGVLLVDRVHAALAAHAPN